MMFYDPFIFMSVIYDASFISIAPDIKFLKLHLLFSFPEALYHELF